MMNREFSIFRWVSNARRCNACKRMLEENANQYAIKFLKVTWYFDLVDRKMSLVVVEMYGEREADCVIGDGDGLIILA